MNQEPKPRVALGDMTTAARNAFLGSLIHSTNGRRILNALYERGSAKPPKHVTLFSDTDHEEENAKIELRRLHRLWEKTHKKKYSVKASELAQRFPHLAQEYRNL